MPSTTKSFIIAILVIVVSATDLQSTYSEDSVLAASNSPYYVTSSNVWVEEGTTLTVENGAEIVFLDDYQINIRGKLIVGCSTVVPSTYTSNVRGLHLITKTMIHSQSNDQKGSIIFHPQYNSNGDFCNVLFEGLKTAISYSGTLPFTAPNQLTIDNCKFSNIWTVSSFWSITNTEFYPIFTDSTFHDINTANSRGSVTFDNCLFERFNDSITDATSNSIRLYNSDIIGDGTTQCIQIKNGQDWQSSIIENNTFTACDTAINIIDSYSEVIIKYNNISDSNIAIKQSCDFQYCSPYILSAQYNNLLNNMINIELDGTSDCMECNYNYFGIKTVNQSLIQSTMNDICNGFGVSLIRFWPWFVSANKVTEELSTLTSTLECDGMDNHPNITENKVNPLYVAGSNTTLLFTESPYYITQNILIQEGAVLNIEDGVEIIFADDYTIYVNGEINVGSCLNDDDNDHEIKVEQRGLFTNYSIFRSDESHSGGFLFSYNTDCSGSFCNVLFDGLNTAFSHTTYTWNVLASNQLSFDHCEFTNILSVSRFSGNFTNGNVPLFTNSKFYNNDGVISYYGSSIFDNCLFETFFGALSGYDVNPRAFTNPWSLQIYNSHIIGDGVQLCIKIHSVSSDQPYTPSKLENNTIINCGTAIYMRDAANGYVKYNNIYNNSIGIDIGNYINDEIQFNNFINNTVNIQLSNSNRNRDCALCNYNYFGFDDLNTSNQTVISSKINDICNGHSSVAVIFWPWFLTQIDVDNRANVPDEGSFVTLECEGIDNYPNITGHRLNVLYVNGTTTKLAVGLSPPTTYYVINDVLIQEGAILIIPPGIEVIFVADYEIIVAGTVIAGCMDYPDTFSISSRGRYYLPELTIKSLNNDRTGQGFGFKYDTDSSGSFCNVLFEGLERALAYLSNYGAFAAQNQVILDNCEFSNIEKVIYAEQISNENLPKFTDSVFYDITYGSFYGSTIFDNCLFERFSDSVGYVGLSSLQITNSEIIGDGTQSWCVYFDWYYEIDHAGFQLSKFENNTISNCDVALIVQHANVEIKFNNISHNNIGIAMNYEYFHVVQYNNFINNSINIRLNDAGSVGDCTYCNYNYWGLQTTNQSLIAQHILDKCDTYSLSLVRFWPWFITAYPLNIYTEIHQNRTFKINSVDNLPEIWTFDYVGCSSIENENSYSITDKPTHYPTMDPTLDPTIDPTVDPTKDPTTEPTIDPTKMPTTPTLQPTVFESTVDDNNNQNSVDSKSQLHENWDAVGYGVVGILVCIPILLLLIGTCFHFSQAGSDSPNYLAIVQCFANIADFYTDIVFCFSLLIKGGTGAILGIAAAFFTFGPHIISIVICLIYVQKWRKIHLQYVEAYDNLIIGVTVLAGFYPTIDFLASKVFHLKYTSLHLTKAQFLQLKQYRFFNNNVLENLPLLIIQLYVLFVFSKSASDVDPVTVMAFAFSVISLTVGLLTLISRAFGRRAHETKAKFVTYKIEVKSTSLKPRHNFIHWIFAENVLSKYLSIHPNRVETVEIISSAEGIVLTVNIKLLTEDDEENIDNILSDIISEQQKDDHSLKQLVIETLKLKNVSYLSIESHKIQHAVDINESQLATHIKTVEEIEMD